MQRPTVSVIIPVYNRPATVRRAIASVLAQTCQEFEIIVVDDGSTDTTPAAVAAFTDPRIRLIRHEGNRGGSAARNTGIQAGTAPFVAFLDSDDEWLPTILDRQLEAFERSAEDLALVYTGREWVFADGSVARHIPRRHSDLARALLTKNIVGETSVAMVRRNALDATGGFDESLPASQDLDLWVRLCERFGADFVPDALVRVAKESDRGRISMNLAGATKARELFCQKHRARMRQHGVLHRYLRDSGWIQQREARDAGRARHLYLESLAVRPVAPLTYVLLLAACLPMSWLDAAARWKHWLSAVLQSGSVAGVHGGCSRPASERRAEEVAP